MLRRVNAPGGFRHLRSRRSTPYLAPSIRRESTQASRVDRITSRLPRRLQKYTKGLRNAPVSHVVSFLILHELTAIVPLFAMFALFHYTTFVPVAYMTSHFGDYVLSGLSRFERYFSRKSWFGFGPGDADKDEADDIIEKWKSGEQKYEILVEVALAYAITKVLLPIRIIGSVWATPWFAAVLLRVKKSLGV
ncbi:putative protein family FLILHELTA [Metarhizium rileyi]|uniref:Uncharacterized protein n=1 Tax=Metarhizium rileyi (strain RCEF 4871) TaxID=1649241 RepID=A0A167CXM9_METRR|nr:putative protein family FLILHELTA [Metarhizium rileyi RCEF 4871]TWU73430.1 hypothetical protein ED733_004285 [Metarhizium rileyi]